VSKTEQNGFGVRTEVTIQWRRAYASSVATSANGCENASDVAAPDHRDHDREGDRDGDRRAEVRHPNWWWDATWNVVAGCSPISAGCKFCYAPRLLVAYCHAPGWQGDGAIHQGVIRQINGQPVFTGRIKIAAPGSPLWSWPLRWRGAQHPLLGPGKPSLAFVGDMADIFHESVPTETIDRIAATLALSSHVGMLLTKRTQRMAEYFASRSPRTTRHWQQRLLLGFSGERQNEFNQRWADMRALADMGWKFFVSIAPMIAPVTLPADFLALKDRAWVICSGEQGKHEYCRDMHPRWARSLRDQCREHGIPFFLKQMAKLAPIPPDLQIREFPALTNNSLRP
jgi:protein gp37